MAKIENINWSSVLDTDIPLNVMLNTLPTKGNLVYEYNPLRNYRLTSNKYWYKENYYTLEELEKEFSITLSQDEKSWDGLTDEDIPELYEAGQLIDFISDELSFSLKNPVNIIPQYSYDGSVNLILNDGLNVPRLINTRFSATGKNTYEIVDRKGNTDTNIYDQGEQFNIDTSLYKIVTKIPKIKFLKTSSGGNLKVGNYHFYFKLADADGNETDFVAESGLVSIFIGESSYNCVHTGTKNENSTKQVEFGLSNIDSAYDYITVYFSRSTAELGDNSVTEYIKINKKFSKTNQKLIITGFEEFENISVSDLNLHYNIIGSAHTQAVCQNMLFMGNVKKQDIPYEKLQDLSLRILPYRKTEEYKPDVDQEYSSKNPKNSYINANYIYNKTGYWPGELYRFGIVYILPNGELTPVFDVRGAYNIGKEGEDFTKKELIKNESGDWEYIKYNNDTNLVTDCASNAYSFENVKGVCSFANSETENLEDALIYSVNFEIPSEVKETLGEYVKGYFFVRQPRIPLKLAQGITIGIDNESRTPTIPTAKGILSRLSNVLSKTHVETEDIEGLNYISEGFLKRYTFEFEKKSSSIWGKIGKIAGVTALVVGAVACAVIPGGQLASAGFIKGAIVVGTKIGISAAITSAAIGAGAGAVVGTVIGGVVASTQELGLAVSRIGKKKRLNGKATVAPSGYKIVETDDSRQLTDSFDDRIIIKDSSKTSVQGIICPDYTINQPFYNQIFTGNDHYIEEDIRQCKPGLIDDCYFTNDYRHFYIEKYDRDNNTSFITAKVIAVPDNIVCTGIDNILFRSRAGEAEEAWRYKCVGEEVTSTSGKEYQKINSDIVRGSFGPYLGFLNSSIGPARIVNIYIPGYNPSNIMEYINIRMCDNSTYNAITDRLDIDDYDSKLIGATNNTPEYIPAYRGDCYICQFTQRINRNFNDPSAPYNDEIVDINTWKDNYDPEDTEKFQQINSGDINAVPLGMWVTFQLRSSNNLNIRTLDGSNVDEAAMTGHPNGYFPVQPMSTEGVYKKKESHIYNKGFTKSLNDKWNFGLPDVPYIKNWFGTRIMYSDIHVNDAYKNGFRVFQGTNYRDYTREYGEIVKLVSFESSLLCIFEHGIALIPVNERAVAGQGAGGNVYINTSNVLPENPKIISDMFGSQWPESILKVPGKTGDSPQYVYGVDTVAKKIWRTDGNTLECISDYKVQEFLNNNITLGERELTPKIGIRNVKTHYNAFKRDVMFTFYDNTYGFEEKVWNLCWNELLQKFITFYSWVPSYMENINNVPFSFDRNTSKWIAKLGTSHTENSFADGITLNNVIVDDYKNPQFYKTDIKYIKQDGTQAIETYTLESSPQFKGLSYTERQNLTKQGLTTNWDKSKFIGFLSLSSRVLPEEFINYSIHYELVRDNYGNYKMFDVIWLDSIKISSESKFEYIVPIYGLFFKKGFDKANLYSELYYRNNAKHAWADTDINKFESINYDEQGKPISLKGEALEYPIYKDITGKRPTLDRERMLNPDKIVTLLNIKATINIQDKQIVDVNSDYYNYISGLSSGTTLVDAGYYESVVAIIPKWNMQFLSTDFWKHGQGGIIDITDTIKPTYWYGKRHPFEFEVIVVNDPSVHKIFDNLELVANRAKPESFHYEIVGDSYDFAKDKPNMYFRQEARKHIWQYNGADICYDRNYLKTNTKWNIKSADLLHQYYDRQDGINDVEDYYYNLGTKETSKGTANFDHLSGGEIVYYPNRQEYRIWNHALAVDIDNDFSKVTDIDSGCRGLIAGNMSYLEDKWRITINPILIVYKNESNWNGKWSKPPVPVYNSPIPNTVVSGNIPEELNCSDIDQESWLISKYPFGEASNRKELDVKDKFMKVRIRYSGEELAVIDFLNTIYRVSYA